MTERLYYRDSDLLAFDATAVEHAGDARHVVLDRTAFYPTSGGQSHDTGLLGASRVIDVIDDNERVVHVLDADLALGPVRGAIDEARRRDHMQQHTAQHLISALAGDRYKWETTSVHFGADHSTIEFATSSASEKQLADLQSWCNRIVSDAIPVTVTFEDGAAADARGLRKPSGRSGEIRVVTIEGIDRSACGGTHVSRTSAIGAVLLHGTEKIRGHVRVGFLAGDRVLRHVANSDAALDAVAAALGCAANQVVDVAAARQQEAKAMREQLVKLEQEVAMSRLLAIYHVTEQGADGLRRMVHRAVDETPAMLRAMAQGVASLSRTTFVATSSAPATIYFATSGDSGIDAGAALKPALAAVGGRGGGSARVAQGSAPTDEALQAVLLAVQQSHPETSS